MPRPRALFLAASFVFVTAIFFHTSRSSNSTSDVSIAKPNQKTSGFHFLTVATSNDLNLCRLLLSAAVLSYPPPVLVDWEGQGEFDAKETHLAKIIGPLRYFDTLPASSDNDLVLLVDGYDVVFQLGPDVLLQRYHETIKASNAQLEKHYGTDHVKNHGTYNTILYGPDVLCYPIDFRRPACWLVPESTLPRDAFGPETDKNTEHTRPRWLNSGTVLGPVKDVKKLFLATMNKVNKTFDPDFYGRNSDQMYLADVWADQEYARMTAKGGKAEMPLPDAVPDDVKPNIFMPELEEGQAVEMHVGIDYKSRIFQTVAGFYDILVWKTFSDSSTANDADIGVSDLPQDVLQAKAPYRSLSSFSHPMLTKKSWRDVPLGFNKITKNVFPIVHFTGEKHYRDLWWNRMWFFPYAEKLLKAKAGRGVITVVDGVAWKPYIPFGKIESAGEDAWADKGDLLPWDALCKEHEGILFNGNAPDEKKQEEGEEKRERQGRVEID